MVEFAMLLPLFAFLLVAGIDFARVYYGQQIITNCARNGALYFTPAIRCRRCATSTPITNKPPLPMGLI